MNAVVEFRVDGGSEADILAHLELCDEQFAAPLSARVELLSYARKIRQSAHTFEAWAGGKLIGLVAAYMNAVTGSAYVTTVSVATEFCGQRIAGRLLGTCLDYARSLGLVSTSLEVSERSLTAIHLYRRFGFEAVEHRGELVLMRCLHPVSERARGASPTT